MANSVQNLIKEHSAHDWASQNTDHIKNVNLIGSHDLMKCPCGWYGWVKKTAFSAVP